MVKNKSAKKSSKKANKAPKAKPAPEVVPDVEAGTWQATIVQSAAIKKRGDAAAAKAGTLLWTGAQAGVTDWLGGAAEEDGSGEGLYNELVSLMGKSRRGDANKIKTVAIAAKNDGLVLSTFPSLNKAYNEAKRLTVTAVQDKDDDHAADEAVTALAEHAPKSTSTAEGAASIVLSKGIDEAARLLLDALNGPSGEQNTAAHRAFFRAVGQDIAGRQPKPEPKAASTGPKVGATKGGKASPKAAPVKPNPKTARKTLAEAQAESDAAVEDAADQVDDSADIKTRSFEAGDAAVPEVEFSTADNVAGGSVAVKEAPAKTATKVKAKPIAKPIQRRV